MRKFILSALIVCIAVVVLAGLCKNNKFINIRNSVWKAETTDLTEVSSDFLYTADFTAGFKNGQNEMKILILGNSISSGLVVDNISDDYINVLMRKIAFDNNRFVRTKVFNLFNFEKFYEHYDYNVLKPAIEFEPDLIIFQLGENYAKGNDKLYYDRLVKLINHFNQDAVKIVLTPFAWGDKDKNKINEDAALATNSFYVDISNLFLYDQETRADYKKKFDNPGLGMHPGEFGMKRIAEEIYVTVNALIKRNLL